MSEGNSPCETPNSVFDQRDVEVDQQAETAVGEFQVGQELRLVNGEQLLDGLQFHNDTSFNEQIEFQPGVDLNVVIPDRKQQLPLHLQSLPSELVNQTSFIDRLKKART